jgi:poly-gamma-glutamate biosynthesis protein PgsC/CapC
MDLSLLSLSIGLGLVVSLLFSELFGLAAGGLVVPGYFALYLARPLDVAATLVAALFTFFLVRIASSFVIVYGRRRTALMILVGYAVGILIRGALAAAFEASAASLHPGAPAPIGAAAALAASGEVVAEVGVIGFIVPGLIAIWLDRQGVVPTLAALLTSAVVVRLILILTVPEALQWFEAGPVPLLSGEELATP